MKTITNTFNIYKFEELSEEAQQTAIEKLWDINVDHEWWEYTYEDAERIGLKITSFDLDRSQSITGELLWNASDVKKAIMENHGKHCNTYKTVKSFDLRKKDTEDKFLYAILQDYLKSLQQESEYLLSEEAIIDTIKANDYDFTKDGILY